MINLDYETFRLEVAHAIVDFEARRDKLGRLEAYELPGNDGGGRYEVAGINERYHPDEAANLAALIKAGRHKDAEDRAADYIARYTDAAAFWSAGHRSIEAFLRDSMFNRGPGGAAKILQLALKAHVEPALKVDGKIGPKTKAALARVADLRVFVQVLREAREYYERRYVGYRENFWKGLVNRWNNAKKLAQRYL